MKQLLSILAFSIFGLACDNATYTSPSIQPEIESPQVLEVGYSEFDASGCRSGWVDVPGQPTVVFGGSEERVYRDTFTFELPAYEALTSVSSFIGTDAGDHFEADVELLSVETGRRIYQRSEHQRGEGYDAWDTEPTRFICNPDRCTVELILLGRTTDANSSPQNLDSFGKLRARFHFGLRFELCRVR